MKNIILILIYLLLSYNPEKSDNFYDTERYFQTDKESYSIRKPKMHISEGIVISILPN